MEDDPDQHGPGFLIDGLDQKNTAWIATLRDEQSQRKAARAFARSMVNRLVEIFPYPFPRGMDQKWGSDDIAVAVLVSDTITPDNAVTFSRLAILRAYTAARDAIGIARGKAERAALVRYGDPLFDLSSLTAWADALCLEKPSTPEAAFRSLAVEMIAERMDMRLERDGKDGERLIAAVKRKRGAHTACGTPEFILSLAAWWWRNTGWTPEKSRGVTGQSRPNEWSFLDYANAAYADATGAHNSDISSAIRRTLEALEKDGAPWSANIANQVGL